MGMRTASKHVWYLGWSRSPAQVGCMRQALGPGALGRPRGSGWRGRWEGGLGWRTHVNPWLFHSNAWQNSLQINKKLCVCVYVYIDLAHLEKCLSQRHLTYPWSYLPEAAYTQWLIKHECRAGVSLSGRPSLEMREHLALRAPASQHFSCSVLPLSLCFHKSWFSQHSLIIVLHAHLWIRICFLENLD